MKLSKTKIFPLCLESGRIKIGYDIFNDIFNVGVNSFRFLALTMDRQILSLETSKELVKRANAANIKVVFIPTTTLKHKPLFQSTKEQYALLDMVASHSADDVKTAALVGNGKIESTIDYQYDAIAYTCNQIICGVKWHAEAILAEYLKVIELKQKFDLWWLMILEPCHSCLLDMTKSDAAVIAYLTDHKAKWNTDEYLRLKTYLQRPDRYVKTIYTKETIVE